MAGREVLQMGSKKTIGKEWLWGLKKRRKRQGEKSKKEQSLEWKIWFVLGPVQREAGEHGAEPGRTVEPLW